ncbi:MAG TPA: molybdopterin-dependent oxidoreductase [Blastocatellia bacterium]|nr:molybdopterin-dependent oxidoreductase [Blastocatellia bacterium]
MQRLNIDGKTLPPPSEKDIRSQVALLASILTLAGGLASRYAFGAPLVPDIVTQFVFAELPISVVEAGVSLLGPLAKQLGFVACTVVYLAALVALAEGFLRLTGTRRRWAAVLLALAASLVTLFGVFPAVGAGLIGRNTRVGALAASVWMFATYAVYCTALLGLTRFYKTAPRESLPLAADAPRSFDTLRTKVLERRRLIIWFGYAVAAIGLYDIARGLVTPWLKTGAGRVKDGNGRFPGINGLALEVTPMADFYEVSKNPSDPDVDAKRWKLRIAGPMIQNPLELDYDQIRSLPYVEQYATLECISNEVGGDLISNALWRGVRLKDLLDKAAMKPGAVKIAISAADDYADSIPPDRAMAEGTILAYLMNGEPLNQTHGFPLRLIVPGIYGMKNVKWITKIEALDYDFKGYWQRRGWDDVAQYKTMSRIDVPETRVTGNTPIAGIAFAGDRGIMRVEVSVDGGQTWEPATIRPPLSAYSWVLWVKDWTPSGKGSRQLLVRATDGRGVTQTPLRASTIPDGASGYDRRPVTVV